MDAGAAMPGFHVRPTGAVAEIMYAVRAQVLDQLACSDHRWSIRLSILANCSADSPATPQVTGSLTLTRIMIFFHLVSNCFAAVRAAVARAQRRKVGQRHRGS